MRSMHPPTDAGQLARMTTARVAHITPEMAEVWLAKKAPNRPPSRRNIELLARQMTEGKWRLNGESIVFDGGRLIDGQNRLAAVVQSGVPIDSVVVENVDPSAFDTIDTGKARTAADVLGFHDIPNARDVASAARYVYHDTHGDPGQVQVLMPSNADIADVVREHPGIVAAASRVSALRTVRGLLTPSIAVYLFYRFSCVNSEDAESMFLRLDKGEGLANGDPVFFLRERLIANRVSKARLPRVEILALAIKAWNAMRAGHRIHTLRWRRIGPAAEKFPIISGGAR